MAEPVQNSASEIPPRPSEAEMRRVWSGPRPAISEREIAARASDLRSNRPFPARFHLQRRASANVRHHVRRAAMRLLALIVVDLLSFGVMRELVHAVREHAFLGSAVSQRVTTLFPGGALNGWQYATALLLGLLVVGTYGPGDQRRDPKRLFVACALATALPLWSTLWTRGVQQVLLQYAVTTMLVWLGIVIERLTINRVIGRVYPPERNAMDTLFVGPSAECVAAASGPAFVTGTDYRAMGFVDIQIPPAVGALGHVSDISLLLAASGARVVAICGHLSDKQFQDVVDSALAAGCEVFAVPRAAEVAGVHPITVWRHKQPLVQLTAPGLRGSQLIAKRALDFFGAMAGLVLLSPLLAIAATVVKLTSRGPVFFRQERVGQGGQLFTIIKLRTMVDGADSKREELVGQSVYRDQRLFKVPSDPRMTRVGRWLRRTSLDELPQLVNVLMGDMSLVGPRPPLSSEVALYEAHHYARFDVKPGITGPWQVAGRNQVTDFEGVIALETEYIRNWSLARDVVILLRTVPAVLKMQGAH